MLRGNPRGLMRFSEGIQLFLGDFIGFQECNGTLEDVAEFRGLELKKSSLI